METSKREPKIGDVVLFFSNPDDAVAKSNHNNDNPIPAIITRVWSHACVNLKIIPDCGPVQDRTSVVHHTLNPAGYHFMFKDEFYLMEGSVRETENATLQY